MLPEIKNTPRLTRGILYTIKRLVGETNEPLYFEKLCKNLFYLQVLIMTY